MKTILYQLQQIIKLLTATRHKLIVSVAKDHLGIDASPRDRATDEYGCAESVTEILVKVGVFNRIITGTWTLMEAMQSDPHWWPVIDPQPGDVLVSPTGESKLGRKAPFVGHTAIVGDNRILMSNDSYSGKWMANYTIDTWKERYVKKGGYPMLFFRYYDII